jgi:hypothetical protein
MTQVNLQLDQLRVKPGLKTRWYFFEVFFFIKMMAYDVIFIIFQKKKREKDLGLTLLINNLGCVLDRPPVQVLKL